jgi:hypothetical protein
MLNESAGPKIVVTGDITVAARRRSHERPHGEIILGEGRSVDRQVQRCGDPKVRFHTEEWKIRQNIANPK